MNGETLQHDGIEPRHPARGRLRNSPTEKLQPCIQRWEMNLVRARAESRHGTQTIRRTCEDKVRLHTALQHFALNRLGLTTDTDRNRPVLPDLVLQKDRK